MASAPGTPRSRYQRQKDRDPAMPKRPTSAYFQFMMENRPAIVAELGGTTDKKAVAAHGSERWRNLPESEKEKYQQRWLKEKKAYARSMNEYKASGAEAAFKAKRKAEEEAAPPAAGRDGAEGAAPNGHAASSQANGEVVDLSKVSSVALMQELSRRLGVDVAFTAPPMADAAPSAGSAEEPRKRRRKAASEELAAPPPAPASAAAPAEDSALAGFAAADSGLPEGLQEWLNPKRRARIVKELDTDDEEEVRDEALIRFLALDEEVRSKYAERARGGTGET